MTAWESFGSQYSRYRTAVRTALESEGASKAEINRILAAIHPLANLSVQEMADEADREELPNDPTWPHTPDVLSKPIEDISLPEYSPTSSDQVGEVK